MGRMKENPRYNVLSFRLADDEIEAARDAANAAGKEIGTFAREILLKSLEGDRESA